MGAVDFSLYLILSTVPIESALTVVHKKTFPRTRSSTML